MQKKDVRTSVRFREDLHEKITKIAKDEKRSFNNLMVVMADEYIERHYPELAERTTGGGDE